MSMKPIVASALLAVVLFASCKKELQPQESSDAVVNEATTPEAQNQELNSQTVQAPSQVQTQVTTTAPGMNPPHGQPGHRCDIAVGAPLNSPKQTKPASGAGSAVVQQVTPSMTAQPNNSAPAILTPNAAQTTTAPGMNPPHGQPGHVCSVAVGAPLPK